MSDNYRLQEKTFAYSDPGTGANTAEVLKGGVYQLLFAFSAMATTTTIKAEISVDGGTTYVDLYDDTHNAVTLTSAVAVDSTFKVTLPPCLFRTNITAAGGATTTGSLWVVNAINEFDA